MLTAACIWANEVIMLGSEAVIDSLTRHDVKRIYIYPGGTIAPILDVAQKQGIEIFCGRHEQGAGYAALAAARLTGKPQVVMVTSGPGVTNIMTTVADAYFDSTPLIVLTGQVGTKDMRGNLPLRQRGFQEVDTIALMKPISKAQFLPKAPNDLPEMMAAAFNVASEGRPGPIVVDLPMNIQNGEVEGPFGSVVTGKNPLPKPDVRLIDQAIEWLCSTRRPVILAGQGIILSQAHSELRRFAEGSRIPVSQSLLALGAFPTNSPLALGFHGHTGNQYANRSIYEADLAIVIGSRLDLRQVGSRSDAFVPHGRVIRIDLDQAELDHSRVRTDLVIFSDAKSALSELNSRLDGCMLPDWSEWLGMIEEWRHQFPLKYECRGLLKPQHIIAVANRLTIGKHVICTSGVGSHQQWTARHFDFDYPSRIWLTSGGHGAMGFDLPAAIGAQLNRPDALVLCFVGDGSLQMNIQELATIAELRLPIKIIVLDNHRLGIVSQFQKLNWSCDPSCGNKWNPDFAAIARAYGINGISISSSDEVERCLNEALAYDGPVLVHCTIDPSEDVVPMLLANQTMDKMWPYA
jgi:acetolactate synthase-1/2/3 large subunit